MATQICIPWVTISASFSIFPIRFCSAQDIEEGLTEVSDWDRFASEAYEMLIASEGGGGTGGGVGGGVDDEDDVEDDEVTDDTGGARGEHETGDSGGEGPCEVTIPEAGDEAETGALTTKKDEEMQQAT